MANVLLPGKKESRLHLRGRSSTVVFPAGCSIARSPQVSVSSSRGFRSEACPSPVPPARSSSNPLRILPRIDHGGRRPRPSIADTGGRSDTHPTNQG